MRIPRCCIFRIGNRILPALLDSGASDNTIYGAIARELKLDFLPLAHPSKVRAANGQYMECVSYVSTLVALDSLSFRLCFSVVDTAMSLISSSSPSCFILIHIFRGGRKRWRFVGVFVH